jgi:hypothetical protein
METDPNIPSTRRLDLALAMALATLIAPAAAPGSVLVVMFLIYGDVGNGLWAIVLAPLAILTIAGFFGYVMAFFAVAVCGTALTLLALRRSRLRPKRIWAAIGAVFGTLIAAAFLPSEPAMLLCGTAAGGSCAFLYRLVIARALAAWPTGDPALDRPKSVPGSD